MSLVGIIVYNNKGSTNLTNHLIKFFVFLWDDSEIILFILLTFQEPTQPLLLSICQPLTVLFLLIISISNYTR